MTRPDTPQNDDDLRRWIDRGMTADDAGDWGAFVDELRAESRLDEVELRRDAARVAEAVLDRTVREDLGWRGDLRLVTGFVRRRLRSSVLLRVAAASLLVHLVALPVLAVYRIITAEPERDGFVVDFEKPDELPFAEPLEEALPLDDDVALPELESLDAPSLAAQNERNADRWSVFRRGEELRSVAEFAWDSALERRLAARASALLDGGAPRGDVTVGGDLERLLRVEEHLDALLFGGVARHDAADLAWLVEQAAGDPPRAALAAAALARAARYGVALPAGADAAIARFGDADFAPFADLATTEGGAPLSAAYVHALRSAAPAGTLSPDFDALLAR